MNTGTPPSLSQQFAAAQGWWREAGVDQLYGDEPVSWLTAPAEETARSPDRAQHNKPAATPVAPQAPSPLDRSQWPVKLAEFTQWWLSEPSLDEGGLFPRIAPEGKAGAGLMVVVEQPEEGDRESLLSGPMGQLLGGILAASGIARDEIYLATALPRHAPLTDWETAQTRILGEVLRHHIGLVAPRRVLLLSSRIPSLLGNDPAQKAASIEQITLGESAVAAMATRDLEGLLNRPRWRAEFWRKWLEWTQEDRKREAL